MNPEVPVLRPMRFDDYGNVRDLLLAHALTTPAFDDWRHRWVDNPLWQRRANDLPIGWVLETAQGEIVGSMESVPTSYKFQGADLVGGASAAWCVKTSYRGYALQLIDEYFSQPVDLFMSTTVGPTAVSTLSQFYGPVPLGRWDMTSYFVTDHTSFARRALQKYRVSPARLIAYPIGWALSLREALWKAAPPEAPRDVSIEVTDGFDSRFDAFWEQLSAKIQINSWRNGAVTRSGGISIRRFAATDCGYLRQPKTAGCAPTAFCAKKRRLGAGVCL